MIQEIEEIVSKIRPISLNEMDSVKLLNRTDTKYVFESSKLPAILNEIASKYAILHIENNAFQDYKTIYFDTEENKMYLAHQNGRSNRYKIRHRTYLSTNAEFLEIKFKTNKGRTFKKRISFPLSENLTNANAFLLKNSPFCGEELIFKLLVEYTRLTFVDLEHGERATVDFNLFVTDCKTGNKIDFSHVAIVELKRDKSSNNSPIQASLKKHRIFTGGMSKYSIGTAAVDTEIKTNRFKKKLRQIEKLKQK